MSEVPGKFQDICDHRSALWTFVRVAGVEPTNNHAEQQVRHSVLLRKVTLGTQSERGSRFIVRMLTVVSTLRKQDRNVHRYLTQACEARVARCPAPSLLPNAGPSEKMHKKLSNRFPYFCSIQSCPEFTGSKISAL
jgi:hypothetical protein